MEISPELDLPVQDELAKNGFHNWVDSRSLLFVFGEWCLCGGLVLVWLGLVFWYSDPYFAEWWWIVMFATVNAVVVGVIAKSTFPLISEGGRFLEEIDESAQDDTGIDGRFESVLRGLKAKEPDTLQKDRR